jgi:hypothetical protein
MACRIAVQESMAKRPAGIANSNGFKISRCFQAVSRERRRAQERSPLPRVSERRQPPLARDDSMYNFPQNVAGLWL